MILPKIPCVSQRQTFACRFRRYNKAYQYKKGREEECPFLCRGPLEIMLCLLERGAGMFPCRKTSTVS